MARRCEVRCKPSASKLATSSSSYGATPVLRDISLTVEPGRVLRAPRAFGLRQVDAAAADRRLQPAPGRRRCWSAARDVTGIAAVEAQRRHGVPELRALAAHDGGAQRRLRARGAPAAARRGPAPGRGRARAGRARRLRRAPAEPALRRPAAARRARPHARDRAAGAAARRAALQPRRQAARADAPGAAAPCTGASASRRSSSPTTRKRR